MYLYLYSDASTVLLFDWQSIPGDATEECEYHFVEYEHEYEHEYEYEHEHEHEHEQEQEQEQEHLEFFGVPDSLSLL